MIEIVFFFAFIATSVGLYTCTCTCRSNFSQSILQSSQLCFDGFTTSCAFSPGGIYSLCSMCSNEFRSHTV